MNVKKIEKNQPWVIHLIGLGEAKTQTVEIDEMASGEWLRVDDPSGIALMQ